MESNELATTYEVVLQQAYNTDNSVSVVATSNIEQLSQTLPLTLFDNET